MGSYSWLFCRLLRYPYMSTGTISVYVRTDRLVGIVSSCCLLLLLLLHAFPMNPAVMDDMMCCCAGEHGTDVVVSREIPIHAQRRGAGCGWLGLGKPREPVEMALGMGIVWGW